MNCPQCGSTMIWQSDWEDYEYDYIFYSLWTCSDGDCEVSVTIQYGNPKD